MEGDRELLFEAIVFPLSELTAQAARKTFSRRVIFGG